METGKGDDSAALRPGHDPLAAEQVAREPPHGKAPLASVAKLPALMDRREVGKGKGCAGGKDIGREARPFGPVQLAPQLPARGAGEVPALRVEARLVPDAQDMPARCTGPRGRRGTAAVDQGRCACRLA
jgi:hypothetical protein